MNWGFHIKRLRESKHLTQGELAQRSGLTRSHISQIERGAYKSFKEETLERLARALEMDVGTLTSEIYGSPTPIREKPEELLERFRLTQPISIPVYVDFPFHAGDPVDAIDYVYLARPKAVGRNIEAYIVHGNCLEPKVNDGDIVVVDREASIETGDIVACLIADQFHIAKIRKIAGEVWLENNYGRFKVNECSVIAPVIEVIRRLK